MRAFIVKFAGLALHIYDLQPGTLTLRHERPEKLPREYSLTEEDFEDGADVVGTSSLATLDTGIPASAVGLQLRLTKNDGLLEIAYQGKNGGVVKWEFTGLKVVNGGKVAASAFTQTEADPSLCSTCGAERRKSSGIVAYGVRSNSYPAEHPDLGLGTEDVTLARPTIGTPLFQRRTLIQAGQTSHLKRKAQESLLLHKSARSTYDSPPWPRRFYMTCCRTAPIFRGTIGKMYIDVKKGEVWFEGWYGKEHTRVWERKQVDIRDPNTKISFRPHKNPPTTNESTHYLAISRLNARLESIDIFRADCCAPDWKTWGTDVKDAEFTFMEHQTEITDPTVIVDALVYCVDRHSGRTPVHDPQRYPQRYPHIESREPRDMLEEIRMKLRVVESNGSKPAKPESPVEGQYSIPVLRMPRRGK